MAGKPFFRSQSCSGFAIQHPLCQFHLSGVESAILFTIPAIKLEQHWGINSCADAWRLQQQIEPEVAHVLGAERLNAAMLVTPFTTATDRLFTTHLGYTHPQIPKQWAERFMPLVLEHPRWAAQDLYASEFAF